MARTYQRRKLLSNDRRILRAFGEARTTSVSFVTVRDRLGLSPNTFRHCVDRLAAQKFITCFPGYAGSITPAGREALDDRRALVEAI